MTDEVQDTMEDIPRHLHPVVQAHGREMFALVMHAGLGRQAAERLAGLAGKHGSKGGMAAVGVLAEAFNQISNAYVAEKGWTQGQLAQCDRDILLASQQRIVVPGSALMLNS